MAKTYRELKESLATLTDEQLDQTIIASTAMYQQGGTELSIKVATAGIFIEEDDNELIFEQDLLPEEAARYREKKNVFCEAGRVVTHLE